MHRLLRTLVTRKERPKFVAYHQMRSNLGYIGDVAYGSSTQILILLYKLSKDQ